ncbi:hypothetical protein D7V83_04870 [bacterium 0.1xD8-71]|nr:hypothetical protein D7V83_04870 [bacterium 0.1xD8-71]
MDTFIDKLAQKRNAQEMIRANSAAEAARMEQMQNQLKAYDEIMQEIRKVNLRTSENVAEVKKVLEECMGKLECIETGSAQTADMEQTLAQLRSLLEERFKQSEDFTHKENVKVYRNVQAAFTEELGRQTEEVKGSKALLPVCVLILIGVIADVVINLIPIINGFMR